MPVRGDARKAAICATLVLTCLNKPSTHSSPRDLSPRGSPGVARAGPCDWLRMEDYRYRVSIVCLLSLVRLVYDKAVFCWWRRFCMEVNYLAVVAVTKAFLPLLKRSKGRVVNLTSMMGLMCGTPLSVAYGASKHAVEIFTSGLRQELRPWGIKVRNGGRHAFPHGRRWSLVKVVISLFTWELVNLCC
jgi:hypothetical protein